ncbi:hypothetical protein Athai_57290 [Actinocatenispora thailandica]|uniref:DUF4097 domain-containing protein n=1 Tax=Actinocatenispora thailandica TaxID=227318 RepID=A0A7R7I051_9ACTN|nr:DUF4097 family beta strand repeat-containing protein [Actinocatenispora thailandica]BCJ38226.1 hypothetical protein Athai_57290 [Actinocatenispora thailandica]
MRVRNGLALVALLLAGGALTGCSMDVGLSGKTTHSVRSFDLSADSLTVLADNDVTVVPGKAGAVTVDRWLTGKAANRASWQLHGDELRVTAPCVGVNLNCGARYRVTVPADLAVSLSTDYGEVSAEGLTGGLNVAAEHGDVRLSRMSGPIRVSTDYGQVSADQLRSDDVMARSDNGDISLKFRTAPTRATARSTYGEISLTVPDSSYHVVTQTKYGDVVSQLTDEPDAKRALTAETDNGDVAIHTTG